MVRLPPRLRPLFPYLKPAYVRVTAAIAPLTQRISRLHGGWLPRGAVRTLEHAAASSGGRCELARPAEVIVRAPMQGSPPDLPLTDDSDGSAIARVVVVELAGARVLGPHRAVITGAGDLVHEVSSYFGTSRPRQHPLFVNPFPGAPLDVDGRLGLLACRGDANYYHFLMDVLPRIGILEQCRTIASPERWYVPAQSRFQSELLEMFGIPAQLRIDATEHPHIRAECLVVPGLPAKTQQNPPWVVDFLRRRLLDQVQPAQPHRRIYITRGRSANNRAVVNEGDVLDLLTARGFEAVDPGRLSVPDQIRTFAGASVIVATHGAALANIVFASPGSSVIELFPAGCVLPDYWRLASGVPGLRYRYLSAFGGPARQTRATAIVRDIEVDLGALSAVLGELS